MIKAFVIFVLVAVLRADELETVTENLEVLQSSNETASRIVNGQPAYDGQFPHQALVIIRTMQATMQCGGSLISPQWVLCAAHCIIGATSIQVFLGSVNRNSMPVTLNGIQINRPSTYNPQTLVDDISLIKLESPAQTNSNVRPVQLPSRSQASNTYTANVLTVSGFGLTTSNQIATTLQYTNVLGIANMDCRRTYGSIITASILCTRGFPNPNQGSCSGDSGGPLIIGQGTSAIVVGIVSFGAAQSCTQGYPQGFTRVGHYLDYIKSVTGISIRA